MLAAGLGKGVRASRIVPALTVGLLIGVLEVVFAASLASLIFSGPASAHLASGVGLTLFAAVAVMTVVALFSGFPGMVASVQDSTAAILATIAASVATELPGEHYETFLTLVVVLALTSVLAGAFFFALGALRLGDLVRFVPYPVVAGFLAGAGWLLVVGGAGVLTRTSLSLGSLPEYARPEALVAWVPGLIFAVALLVLVRRFRHFLVLPGAVAAAVAIFYVVLPLSGTRVVEAKTRGWLLGPFPSGAGLWKPLTVEAIAGAEWGVVLGQVADIGTLLVVGVLAFLLIATGIELAVRQDVDLNRELRVAGMGNIVAALGGGIVGFHALAFTALAARAGRPSRVVGIVASAVCAATLVFGAGVVSLFPRAVLGGLIVFVGLAFLVEWAYEPWFKLPRRDCLVVILILLAVASFGFLLAVAVGMVLAIALFVIDYSRTNVVRHELSGSTYQSKVEREPRDRELLRREGERIYVLELQGFVFFGTSNFLLKRIRARLADAALPPTRFLVLDFRLVNGVDASAVMSFTKALQLAESMDFVVVLTGLRDGIRQQMERSGLAERLHARLRIFSDLDHGMQWCEDKFVSAASERDGEVTAALPVLLRDGFGGIDPERLMGYLEPVEVEAGHSLIRQGEPSDDVYFLESGRLTAQLVAADGQSVRLRTMGPGTVVGEVTMYLDAARTASVVSEEPSRLYRLTQRRLEEMERRDPQLAAAVHRLFATLLADRLSDALRSMDALLD